MNKLHNSSDVRAIKSFGNVAQRSLATWQWRLAFRARRTFFTFTACSRGIQSVINFANDNMACQARNELPNFCNLLKKAIKMRFILSKNWFTTFEYTGR